MIESLGAQTSTAPLKRQGIRMHIGQSALKRIFFCGFLTFLNSSYATQTVNNKLTQVGPVLSTSPYIPGDGVGLDPSTLSLSSQDTPAYNPYLCITNTSTSVVTSLGPLDPTTGAASSASTTSYGNAWYFGSALRYGPSNSSSSDDKCSDSATYIGWLSFSLSNYDVANPSNAAFSGNPGIHVTVDDLAVSSSTGDITGSIALTDIDVNMALNSVQPNKSYWQFPGINLSGNEFSNYINAYTIPNLSEADSSTSYTDLANMNQFILDGIQVVRLPVSWGFLFWNSENTNGNTTVPTASAAAGTAAPYRWSGANSGATYTQSMSPMFNSYIAPTIASLTNAGITVMVDLHTYFRYPAYGSQYSGCTSYSTVPCPDGTLITDQDYYTDIWGAIYQALKDYTFTDVTGSTQHINMDYIMFDLINEPTSLSGVYATSDTSGDLVFTTQANVIQYLQSLGFTGYILVEGNHWSGLHSWTTYRWGGVETGSYCTETNSCPDGASVCCSNSNLFTAEKFNSYAFDKGVKIDTDKIIINVHQYLDAESGFSGTSTTCSTDLTTTDDDSSGDKGFNLNAFVTWLQSAKLNAMVTEFGGGLQSGNTNSPTCAIALQQFMDYLAENIPGVDENGKTIYGFLGWTIWSTGHGWGSSYTLLVTPTSYQWNIIKPYLSHS